MNPAFKNSMKELTGKEVRANRWWSRLGDDVTFKPSRQLAVDEENVVLPFGALDAVAAGVTSTLTATAQRDCIVRDLIVQAHANATGAETLDATLTNITVAGKTVLGGNGSIPINMFNPRSFDRPEFDLPVKGGTAVLLTIVNDSGAAIDYRATMKID